MFFGNYLVNPDPKPVAYAPLTNSRQALYIAGLLDLTIRYVSEAVEVLIKDGTVFSESTNEDCADATNRAILNAMAYLIANDPDW